MARHTKNCALEARSPHETDAKTGTKQNFDETMANQLWAKLQATDFSGSLSLCLEAYNASSYQSAIARARNVGNADATPLKSWSSWVEPVNQPAWRTNAQTAESSDDIKEKTVREPRRAALRSYYGWSQTTGNADLSWSLSSQPSWHW